MTKYYLKNIWSMKSMTAHLCGNSEYNSLCLPSFNLYNFHDQQMDGERWYGRYTIMWKETTAVILSFGECHKFEISGIISLSVFKCIHIKTFPTKTTKLQHTGSLVTIKRDPVYRQLPYRQPQSDCLLFSVLYTKTDDEYKARTCANMYIRWPL